MENNIQSKGEIIIYQTSKKKVELKVRLEKESLWLNLNQIASLFNTDKSGISRHIMNIYQSKELNKEATVAKIATVQKEGERIVKRDVEFYNLDMIISIGYRVNSQKATQFRIWATSVLKKYLLQGYAVNEKRLLEAQNKFQELQTTISFLQRQTEKEQLKGSAKEILNLLADYSKTLSILDKYDKEKLRKPNGKKGSFVLEYKKCLEIITELKKELIAKKEAGDIFGMERNNAFESIVKNLYQTFGGKELYKNLDEKSAHLLYLTIKDYPFSDGNKRIGSFLFVYFLDKNNYLYKKSGEKKINDNALVALALLIAESNPKEKDTLIKIVINLLND